MRWSAAAAAEAAAERARVAEATGADDDRDAVERDGRIVEKGQKRDGSGRGWSLGFVSSK